jgi:hypothetical protein
MPSLLLQDRGARLDAAGIGDTLTIDATGRLAALGARREILIVELEWPWEPCRVLPTPDLLPAVALEWQPQHGPGSGRTIACACASGALRLYDGAAEPGARSLLVTLCGGAAAGSGGASDGPSDVAVEHVAWRPSAPHTLAAATAGGGLALFDCRAGSAWHMKLRGASAPATAYAGGGGGGLQSPVGAGRDGFGAPASLPASAPGRVSWCGAAGGGGGAGGAPEYLLAASEGGVLYIVDVRRPSALRWWDAHAGYISSIDWSGSDALAHVALAQSGSGAWDDTGVGGGGASRLPLLLTAGGWAGAGSSLGGAVHVWDVRLGRSLPGGGVGDSGGGSGGGGCGESVCSDIGGGDSGRGSVGGASSPSGGGSQGAVGSRAAGGGSSSSSRHTCSVQCVRRLCMPGAPVCALWSPHLAHGAAMSLVMVRAGGAAAEEWEGAGGQAPLEEGGGGGGAAAVAGTAGAMSAGADHIHMNDHTMEVWGVYDNDGTEGGPGIGGSRGSGGSVGGDGGGGGGSGGGSGGVSRDVRACVGFAPRRLVRCSHPVSDPALRCARWCGSGAGSTPGARVVTLGRDRWLRVWRTEPGRPGVVGSSPHIDQDAAGIAHPAGRVETGWESPLGDGAPVGMLSRRREVQRLTPDPAPRRTAAASQAAKALSGAEAILGDAAILGNAAILGDAAISGAEAILGDGAISGDGAVPSASAARALSPKPGPAAALPTGASPSQPPGKAVHTLLHTPQNTSVNTSVNTSSEASLAAWRRCVSSLHAAWASEHPPCSPRLQLLPPVRSLELRLRCCFSDTAQGEAGEGNGASTGGRARAAHASAGVSGAGPLAAAAPAAAASTAAADASSSCEHSSGCEQSAGHEQVWVTLCWPRQLPPSLVLSDASTAGGDASIAGRDASTEGRDASIAGRDASIAGGDASIAGRDASIAGGDASIGGDAGLARGKGRGQAEAGGPGTGTRIEETVARPTHRPPLPPTAAGSLLVSEAIPGLQVTWEKAGAPDLASLVDAVHSAIQQDHRSYPPPPLAAAFALAPLSPPAARAVAAAAVCAALLPFLRSILSAAQRVRAVLEMQRWRSVRAGQLVGRRPGLSPSSATPPDDSSRGCSASPSAETAGVFISSGSGRPLGLRAASSVQQYDRLPPPRTSGACFSPTGLLITFSNSPSPYAALSESEAPRSYHDFLGLVQGLHLAPIVRAQLATAETGLATSLLRRRDVAAPGDARPALADGPGRGDTSGFLFDEGGGACDEEGDDELLQLRQSIYGAGDAEDAGDLRWLDGCGGGGGAHAASRSHGLDGIVSFPPATAVERHGSARAQHDTPTLHAAPPPPLPVALGPRAAHPAPHTHHATRGPPAARLRLSWGRRQSAGGNTAGGKGKEGGRGKDGVRSKSRLRLLRSLGAMPASRVHAYDAAAALEVGMELARGRTPPPHAHSSPSRLSLPVSTLICFTRAHLPTNPSAHQRASSTELARARPRSHAHRHPPPPLPRPKC